ncbi:mitochondrial ribosome-associated GTPase 1 [Orycteropus afer afer]|uniref:Mitochondrial ribosome-associated GTPase 1 n=1 Tax=Orycteropus afer afer TaxID=1230840 RepID=A0A8B6ZH88_ORYAF|nr:mitochondrial ribosome-associated GTPase 1 [Orycteropus afer afer]
MRLFPRALGSAARFSWRENFPLGGRDVARWFPGHMAKGLKRMQSSLKLVDCIIEVHDARIPLSGRNPLFQETLGLKPHLLVLNKMDLADLREQQKIRQHLEGEGLKNVIFTNCVKDENVGQIIPMVTELIGSSCRYHRGENLEYCVMVIGIPNVGKSSLINSIRRLHLRKGKATRVGGHPGITRAVMSRIQVCERPLVFLLDTPGVLAPRIENVETGLKLAVCGTVLDHLVGEETMADYLLYTFNKHQLFRYVQHYGLGNACDDLETVLKRVAVKLGRTQKVKVLTGTGDVNVVQPNYTAAASDFLRAFRGGLLGPVMLDQDILCPVVSRCPGTGAAHLVLGPTLGAGAHVSDELLALMTRLAPRLCPHTTLLA